MTDRWTLRILALVIACAFIGLVNAATIRSETLNSVAAGVVLILGALGVGSFVIFMWKL
jgi:hypothetical protein